jgi:hypothetical protein
VSENGWKSGWRGVDLYTKRGEKERREKRGVSSVVGSCVRSVAIKNRDRERENSIIRLFSWLNASRQRKSSIWLVSSALRNGLGSTIDAVSKV